MSPKGPIKEKKLLTQRPIFSSETQIFKNFPPLPKLLEFEETKKTSLLKLPLF